MTHAYDRCTLGLLAQRGNRTQCRPTVYRLIVWSVMVDCHEGEVFIVWGMLVLRYILLLLYTVGEIVNIIMVVYNFLFFSSAVVYFDVEECSTISGSVT